MKTNTWLKRFRRELRRLFGKPDEYDRVPYEPDAEPQEPELPEKTKSRRFAVCLTVLLVLVVGIAAAGVIKLFWFNNPTESIMSTHPSVMDAPSKSPGGFVMTESAAPSKSPNPGGSDQIVTTLQPNVTKGRNPLPSIVGANPENASAQKLDKYDSPYTMCCKNADGTYSAYVFASPVSYKNADGQYVYIDNSIVKDPDAALLRQGYPYRNAANSVLTYFPQSDSQGIVLRQKDVDLNFAFVKSTVSDVKLENSKNMYGDLTQSADYGADGDAVRLKNTVTKTGVASEIVLSRYPGTDSFQYKITVPGYKPEDTSTGGYTKFLKNGQIGAIVSCGFAEDSGTAGRSGHISLANGLDVLPGDTPDTYTVTFRLDDSFLTAPSTVYPVRFDALFDLYNDKLADDTVYSATPDDNAYYSPFSVIGNSAAYGDGEAFVRFRYNYFFLVKPDDVLSSAYHIRELTGNRSNLALRLNAVGTQWWCYLLSWNTRSQTDRQYSALTGNTGSGDTVFDVTQYAKDCFADSTLLHESYGLAMQADGKSGDYRVFASADNTEYTPYVVTRLKSPPQVFHFEDSINPGY